MAKTEWLPFMVLTIIKQFKSTEDCQISSNGLQLTFFLYKIKFLISFSTHKFINSFSSPATFQIQPTLIFLVNLYTGNHLLQISYPKIEIPKGLKQSGLNSKHF